MYAAEMQEFLGGLARYAGLCKGKGVCAGGVASKLALLSCSSEVALPVVM